MELRTFLASEPFAIRPLGKDELPLIDEALTHDSYSEENPGTPCNGRLEFLGDAVLGLIVCDALYAGGVGPEGPMTDAKQGIVSNANISGRVLERLPSLDNMLLVGNGHTDRRGNSVLTEKMRADAFEALVGALYLTRGIGAARDFVERVLLRQSPGVEAREEGPVGPSPNHLGDP